MDEAEKILSLKETYPYSQVLHALAARLSKDHGLPSRQSELQLAAVYASDRAVLKEIMTRVVETWPASNEVTGLKHPETPESIVTHQSHDEPTEDLAEELLNDLHRLNELRHNFESMFIDTENTTIRHYETPPVVGEEEEEVEKTPENEEIKAEPEEKEALTPKKKTSAKKRSSGKSKAQRIVELAKGLQTEEADNESLSDEEEDKKKEESQGNDIIKEIKSSKKKLNPETDKQREQLQIINQFIKAQPSIASIKDKSVAIAHGDLSSIKSGEFGDNVISETLVEILIQQGKKDKAIEVLKKLIWKFPQKKGYFAAQIEDLKK